MDLQIRKASSLFSFKNTLLKLSQPVASSYFSIHNPVGSKLLTRLEVGLSHLNERKFKRNFSNCIHPLSSCSVEVESTAHIFLHCLRKFS